MNMKMTMRAVVMVAVCGVMALKAMGGENQVAIYTVGKVDTGLQSRVSDWVSGQLLAVTNAGVLSQSGTLANIQELGKAKVRSNTVAVLILAERVAGMTERHVLAQDKVVVVNMGTIGKGLKANDEQKMTEALVRRVEKESLGGLAFVLGMDRCVLPTCVLFPTPTIDELDLKGRGLCPPCMGKWEARMGAGRE
jgi:predicted Zn-dependent protease